MKVAKPSAAAKSRRPFAPVLLLVVLAVLFYKSFLPGYVHFANDDPLGQLNTAWIQPLQGMTGMWDDLNTVGANAGASTPTITTLMRWVLGPVGYAKFLTPIALLILGLGAWSFFGQLRLSPLAATLGALAATLNSTFFSDACWGVASHQVAFGMDFFALALIVFNSPETPALVRWTRLALAGLCVGINVMEAADIGAIFSLLVAAFVFYKALTEEKISIPKKISRGIARVAIVALFAGFIAFQAVSYLVSTNIQGIAGTQQDAATKAAHWNFATQWSFPKIESLGIIVPGLFGYRMDTPVDMMPALQDAYKGGNYWGAIGRGAGTIRFSGEGYYAGVTVILVALWAIAQLFRRQNSIFPETHRRFLWFWTAVLVVSLPLSWGKFAPFYALLYKLPYFSTIRDPTKFLYVFSLALVIIFAYGIHGLGRRCLEIPAAGSTSIFVQLKTWWTKVRGFDRNWTYACAITIGGALLAWLIYGSEKPDIAKYLQTVGFSDEDMAKQIAAFSVAQVGWFILFFALATGLLMLVLAGVFSGRRAKWCGIFLGALLILDLGRADLPWIIHWNYIQKYDIDPANPANSTNPILNFLRDKSYEHRVVILPFSFPQQFALFENLYRIEWAQHQFPYYNIQSLDIIQMPRMPADLEAFDAALSSTTPLRRWELTNTRYLLGPAGFLDPLNEQLDPAQHRFRIIQGFSILPKPGIAVPYGVSPEQFANYLPPDKDTAVPNSDGPYALFEFTGALPRARLYTDWQVAANDPATLQQWVKTLQQQVPKEMGEALAQLDTNDMATLYTLASTNFDPAKIVLVSTNLPSPPSASATNENPGTVEFKPYDPKWKKNELWKKNGFCYAPKDIVLDANATAPSVLLLNDKFDPNWRVTVDGKPAKLLRCNFIMRGVYLTPGAHTVEFQFSLPIGPLYITCAAWVIGILLLGLLIFSKRKSNAALRA